MAPGARAGDRVQQGASATNSIVTAGCGHNNPHRQVPIASRMMAGEFAVQRNLMDVLENRPHED